VPPPRDVAEAIARQQKLDLLSGGRPSPSPSTSTSASSSTPAAAVKREAASAASPPRMTPTKRLHLVDDEDDEGVATEVDSILSGKVLDTDISAMPEFEELMRTESENFFPLFLVSNPVCLSSSLALHFSDDSFLIAFIFLKYTHNDNAY
jgi:hypothetical protein